MKIDPKEVIAGIRLLEIRKLFNSVSINSDWGKEHVVSRLKISSKQAGILLEELEQRGLIERSTVVNRKQCWRKTIEGSALGLASGAKPVKRKTADQVFSGFMERVHQVNEDERFLARVRKVIVFGSYLGDSPTVNDIDIAVEIVLKTDHPRLAGKSHGQAVLDYAHEAQGEGKNFVSFTDLLLWPLREVELFLKSRSRTISLHPVDDEILNIASSRTVYSEP